MIDEALVSGSPPAADSPAAGALPGPHQHPCSPVCITPHSRVRALTRWVRGASALCVIAVAPLLRPWLDLRKRWVRRLVRAWARALLRTLGVRVEVRPPEGQSSWEIAPGSLVASNHISWLDMLALMALHPVTLISKADVAGWPLLGKLASRAGTVFIPRGRPAALREAVHEVAHALRNRDSVGFFPEGATWCGRAGGRYHAALFQAAMDSEAPVVPIALRYRAPGNNPATAQAYVQVPLRESIGTVLGLRRLTVEVHVLPPVRPRAAEGRTALAQRVQAAADAVRFHLPEPGRAGR